MNGKTGSKIFLWSTNTGVPADVNGLKIPSKVYLFKDLIAETQYLIGGIIGNINDVLMFKIGCYIVLTSLFKSILLWSLV